MKKIIVAALAVVAVSAFAGAFVGYDVGPNGLICKYSDGGTITIPMGQNCPSMN